MVQRKTCTFCREHASVETVPTIAIRGIQHPLKRNEVKYRSNSVRWKKAVTVQTWIIGPFVVENLTQLIIAKKCNYQKGRLPVGKNLSI